MNFKKYTILAAILAAATLASTSAHADIPGMRGWHFLEFTNNVAKYGGSIHFSYGQHLGGECVNVKAGQTIKLGNFRIQHGDTITYGFDFTPNCNGKIILNSIRRVQARPDNKTYLQLRF